MRLTLHDGEPGEYKDEDVLGFAWAEFTSSRVGFTTEWASSRCKLANPDDPRMKAAMRGE